MLPCNKSKSSACNLLSVNKLPPQCFVLLPESHKLLLWLLVFFARTLFKKRTYKMPRQLVYWCIISCVFWLVGGSTWVTAAVTLWETLNLPLLDSVVSQRDSGPPNKDFTTFFSLMIVSFHLNRPNSNSVNGCLGKMWDLQECGEIFTPHNYHLTE